MKLRLAIATAAVSLALPAAASANTYCVNNPPCLLGATKPTVQEALDAAAQHAGPDVVRIGARSEPYTGAYSYDEPAFDPVQIIGDGSGVTTLAAPSTAPALGAQALQAPEPLSGS